MPSSDPWSTLNYFLSQQNLQTFFIPSLKSHFNFHSIPESLPSVTPELLDQSFCYVIHGKKEKEVWLWTSLRRELQFLQGIKYKLNATSQHHVPVSRSLRSENPGFSSEDCWETSIEMEHLFPLAIILSLLLCLLVVSSYCSYALQKVRSSNEIFFNTWCLQ